MIYDTIEHISDLAVKNTNLKIHEPGTFLMAITGLEAEGTRGRCAFVGAPSATNQSCLALNSTDKLRTDYLFWFYRQWGNYLAFKYCQGTKQQSYTAAIVKKLPICCPKDPEEQIAIATALSDTDTLIAALDKKIAKKQQIKQGAMQQLLSGKKRLPGFNGEWVEKKLGENFFVRSGYGFPILFQGNKDGIIPFYKVSDMNNIGNGIFLSKSNNYISEEVANRLNIRLFKRGSILFAKIGAAIFLERKRIATSHCSIDNNMMGLEKKEASMDERYFYHLLNTIKLSDLSSSSALPSLSSSTIENILILIPNNKPEQTAIAQILTDMDNEIAQLEKERDKYKELKAGMMQVLLKGKVRLV